MKASAAFLLLSAVSASTLRAGEKPDDFHSIVRRVEQHYGRKHMLGGVMGLVGFASHFTRPMGASDFKIAIIQGIEPDEAAALPEFEPGPEWRPFIRTTTRKGERTVMYGRADGRAVRTLMVVVGDEEAVVMQMRLDPAHFARFVSDKSRD